MKILRNLLVFLKSREGIFLGFLVVFSGFFRLYKIGDYMTFLGDEGRDVMIAREILHGNLTLLGPRSSAADFFYGPIYYYLITPFLWLWQYDPVGPAVMVALIGIATVVLVFLVARRFFGLPAAIAASLLYAVSPLVIAYSRSSWNPNPLPFVSLLILYLLYFGVKSNSLKLFILVGFLLGIALQLQYLALFLATIVAVFTLIGSLYNSKKVRVFGLVKRYVAIFIGFLIGFSPFLAFEVRHGFPNARTILKYIFTDDLEPVNYDAPSASVTVPAMLFMLFGRLITKYPPPEQINMNEHIAISFWFWATILIAVVSIGFIIKTKDKLAMILVLCWLVLGIGLFGVYKDKIHDYHLGFLFPLPFLLVGNFIGTIYSAKKMKLLSMVLAGLIFGSLFIFNLQANPFKYPPNKQKDQVRNISEFVISKAEGKPFNFALLTLGNSDHAYRYFMELNDRRPVEIQNHAIDPERNSVTTQLLIVCEDPNCKPLGSSLWEVAGFGRAEIEGEWQISVVKVYKLRHYQK